MNRDHRALGEALYPLRRVWAYYSQSLLSFSLILKRQIGETHLLEHGVTLGQTLALLLRLVTIRDLGQTVFERRSKRFGRKLLEGARYGKLDVKEFVKLGVTTGIRGEKYGHKLARYTRPTSLDSKGQTALLRAADNQQALHNDSLLVRYSGRNGRSAFRYVAEQCESFGCC